MTHAHLLSEATDAAMRNDWTSAYDALYRAHEIDDLDGGIITGMGLCLLNLGKVQEAVDVFRSVVVVAPSSAEAHNNLGVVLMLTGDDKAAEGEFQMALTFDPEYMEAWKNMALLMMKGGYRQHEGVQILDAVCAFSQDGHAHAILSAIYEAAGNDEASAMHASKITA